MRATKKAETKKSETKKAAPVLTIRLNGRVSLQTQADKIIFASLDDDYVVSLGQFSAATFARARNLSTGLPIASLARKSTTSEMDVLVQRLARNGFLEYRLSAPRSETDIVVIEPQMPEYWPQRAKLGSGDTVVLSRFAYMRRRGNEMVLESPRAGALFRIGDPAIAATLAALSQPRKLSRLRRHAASSFSVELLELLLDSQILLKLDAKGGDGLRVNEGDSSLVLWDFHDLVFHSRSTEGGHANPLGGTFAFADVIAPLPAVRPPWPGKKIDLRKLSSSGPNSPFTKLLRERRSLRDFDDEHPITLAELAQFLDTTARVLSEWTSGGDGEAGPEVTYSSRPYPAAGSAYELELYLAISNCDGLAPGLYHYDAGSHSLAAIDTSTVQLETLSTAARFAMDAPAPRKS